MAIDTAGKRASCIAVGLAIARVWPIPDGSLASTIDRPHMAYCYSLAADDVAVPVPLCLAQTALPTRTLTVSPASVRTLEQTALATRTLTITLEVCDE